MYPGIQCMTKKHHLARNLMNMHKAFPLQYDFFPKTWLLPSQMTDLRNNFAHNQYNSKKSKVTYIVKPDSLAQGNGIFLTRNIELISDIVTNVKANPTLEEPVGCGYIVQQYIDRPHLIDNLKYDLRIYVFLYGVSPLRIYLH
jgi:tubulin polyglutamylase TTLL6/13